LKQDQIGSSDIGTQRSLRVSTLSKLIHEWRQPVTLPVNVLTPNAPPRLDLSYPPVFGLHRQGPLEIRYNSRPCISLCQGIMQDRFNFVDLLLEDGINELLLVGKTAVGRPDADACMMRDIVQGRIETTSGK
jgi:hypothetical protein